MARTTFSGPVASTNGFEGAMVSTTPTAVTAATYAATAELAAGRVVTLDRAAGQAVTLPAATGSGAVYRFFILTTVTTPSTTITATSSGTLAGAAVVANDTDASASIFETVTGNNTITLNGTTTGGIKGGMVTLTDVSTNLWHVATLGAATGTEATPFSTV